MDITLNELREKEVININSGKKLGRIIDAVFDLSTSKLKGVMVPGDKKLFKKSEDVVIFTNQIKRIGDDVILVSIYDNQFEGNVITTTNSKTNSLKINGTDKKSQKFSRNGSFVRFRRIVSNKYK